MSKEVTFTVEEVEAIYSWLDDLSGGNASNIFCWDGTDSIETPYFSAAYKVFKTCGRSVPKNLEVVENHDIVEESQ